MGGSDCEAFRDGWLAQPANAVSSLAFLAAGAYVLARARHADGSERPTLVAGAVALAMVSFGSLAFHGPQPAWADFAHDSSIAALLAVYLARGLGAGAPGVRSGAALGAGVLAIAAAVVAVAPSSATVVHGALAAPAAVVHVRRRDPQAIAYRSDAVAVTVVALAVGAGLFVLGRTGAPLCAPHSLVQAHAGWHICAAVAAAAAFAAGAPRRRLQG